MVGGLGFRRDPCNRLIGVVQLHPRAAILGGLGGLAIARCAVKYIASISRLSCA